MKTRLLFASLLVLLTSLPCVAAPADKFVVPEQKIEGADSPIPLGELVDLTISPIKTPPPNLASTSYVWRVYEDGVPKHVREYQEGIFFGAGIKPKKLLAECVVVYLYVVKDGDKVTEIATRVNFLSADVVIGPPEPPPGPGPSPPPPAPGPGPVLPDGKFKLAATAYSLAMSRVNLAAPARQASANAMAISLKAIASMIGSGVLKSPEDILKQTKQSNNDAIKAVSVDVAAWDNFGSGLEDVLVDLYKQKKLVVAADYATAWLELAAGLEQVK